MANNDQTVPKLYVNINILMKKHQIFTDKRLKGEPRWLYMDQYFGLYGPYFPSSH